MIGPPSAAPLPQRVSQRPRGRPPPRNNSIRWRPAIRDNADKTPQSTAQAPPKPQQQLSPPRQPPLGGAPRFPKAAPPPPPPTHTHMALFSQPVGPPTVQPADHGLGNCRCPKGGGRATRQKGASSGGGGRAPTKPLGPGQKRSMLVRCLMRVRCSSRGRRRGAILGRRMKPVAACKLAKLEGLRVDQVRVDNKGPNRGRRRGLPIPLAIQSFGRPTRTCTSWPTWLADSRLSVLHM